MIPIDDPAPPRGPVPSAAYAERVRRAIADQRQAELAIPDFDDAPTEQDLDARRRTT